MTSVEGHYPTLAELASGQYVIPLKQFLGQSRAAELQRRIEAARRVASMIWNIPLAQQLRFHSDGTDFLPLPEGQPILQANGQPIAYPDEVDERTMTGLLGSWSQCRGEETMWWGCLIVTRSGTIYDWSTVGHKGKVRPEFAATHFLQKLQYHIEGSSLELINPELLEWRLEHGEYGNALFLECLRTLENQIHAAICRRQTDIEHLQDASNLLGVPPTQFLR